MQFKAGERATIGRNISASSEHAYLEGWDVEVIRLLTPEEADAEVGPMYEVRTDAGRVLHVFEDELVKKPR